MKAVFRLFRRKLAVKLYERSRAVERQNEGQETGQASIMMGIMLLTFVFFFAFVVNIGMLVNAKINLQNAADLAAYAGAAVQARQLTQISYLNYEMRRQYKKFIFRYYVLGNMAQANFPRGGMGNAASKSPMFWSPDGRPEHDYKGPVVCMIFQAKDNPCQIADLPPIPIPAKTSFDTINDTLTQILTKIEDIRQNNCVASGTANTLVLSNWLWNTDPDFSALSTNPDPTDTKAQITAIIKGLTRGIGLVPRELILKRRIDTLAEYVNQKRVTGIDFDGVNNLMTSQNPEPAASERTIQAFLSAYYTLGNWTFNGPDIKMDEIMNQNQLLIQPITVRFSAYAIDFNKPTGSSSACVKMVKPDGVKAPLPVGVYKDPSVLTYYAIRLKAKARLLFSPFGDLELTAYSAAQPFGSRIGPKLTENDFIRTASVALQQTDASKATNPGLADQLPNLPLRDDNDHAAAGQGWDTKEAMGSMFQAFNPPNAPQSGAVGGQTIDEEALQRAYHVAMAPNHYEGKRYNIPYDGDDLFVRNFDSNRIMTFWAPVYPMSKAASMDSNLEELLKQYTPDAATFDSAKTQFLNYFAKLRAGTGEPYDLQPINASGWCANCEGFNFVRIADPTNTRPVNGGPTQPIANFGGFITTDPKEFRSSWADVWNADYAAHGRIGYSVKFVSFDLLRKGVTTAPGQKNSNLLDPDPELEQSIEFIKH